jgi:hypothetical protein
MALILKKMKRFLKTAKFVAIGLFALAVTGCSTTNYKSVEPWQGQVWRVVVIKQFVDTSSNKASDEYIASTKYMRDRDAGMRLARVHLSSGWNSVIAAAIVPDGLEFSQLERGTLVDVKTETGPNTDYNLQRFTRILGIVCRKDDSVCMEREKTAKHVSAVIDENPPEDISAKYGATYSRRLTAEEIKKYD